MGKRLDDDGYHSLKPTAKTTPENRPTKTPKGNENETYSKHPFSGACKLLVSREGRCFFPQNLNFVWAELEADSTSTTRYPGIEYN